MDCWKESRWIICKYMYGWMDEWIDGWMDGLREKNVDGK